MLIIHYFCLFVKHYPNAIARAVASSVVATVPAALGSVNVTSAVDGDFDGTLEADAITVAGATLSSVIQDEATALAIALG